MKKFEYKAVLERLSATIKKLGPKKAAAIGGGSLAAVLALVLAITLIPGPAAEGETGTQLDAMRANGEVLTEESYAVIYIDGVAVANVASAEDAQAVLNGVVANYQTAGSEIKSYEIKEDIQVAVVNGQAWDTMTVEGAISMIVNGMEEVKTYTVVSGDSYYKIAGKMGMTYSELLAANPTSTPDKLKIGQILNVVETKPMVHVTIDEVFTVTESVAYKTSYKETSALWKGEYQVQSYGKKGKNEVTYQVVSENGVQVSKETLSTEVISEPVTQITLKGTKPLSTVIGTGSFVNPMDTLRVSSAFGVNRSRFGRHYGIDWYNPTGTPIYVVDDGVVTFAGEAGTYGYLVKVSHGSNVETYYAHCSKLLVKIGDVVTKGQTIALVGNTGRSTGPHLHFEVRVNGIAVNPVNYLP
ncbi:MAG: peptidoglycan DD-metalloendopeptidase family protein [Firmicutes bacterium]|nr:peptidoglycan DD-metalloendopeptidase family protein [Bacillota bacterium]